MPRNILLLMLALLISGPSVLPANGQSDPERREKEISKVRSMIAKRGIGPKAKVKVILLDGAKLQGYVSEATAKSFTVVAASTGNVVVPFSQVKQVKGAGLSTRAKVGIGLGIGAVAFTVVIGLVNAALDD